MAYKSTIPAATDKKKISQADLQNNFIALKALIDENHETFGAGDEGKHIKTTLTDQTAAPPASLANEVVLYSNAGELCLNKDTGAEIEFTKITGTTDGSVTLPSGVILKWGMLTSAIAPVAIAFPVAFPNHCYSINLTHRHSSVGNNRDTFYVYDLNKTNFTPICNSANNVYQASNFYYFAIGV